MSEVDREAAAHEVRSWVRLTSRCNNRCVFCLDTLAHAGAAPTSAEIKSQIIAGRRRGATRLILSGGEPTVHRQFVSFVRFGRRAGYERVQTVTNGRMFAYPDFLDRCIDAGLGEITFSVHGHDVALHDELTGVSGAFDQVVRAIELALGRVIVNVDVCLNGRNIDHLGELLDRFIALGVREFDLLHLIPFGRAFEPPYRERLAYDIDQAMPSIQAALRRSEDPDLHIWFNRFPPPYLEGYEHLIQEPHKLQDEARGRFEEYELWLTRDVPLSCREPARCNRCYLERFCDTLQDTVTRVDDRRFDAFRSSDPGSGTPPDGLEHALEWIVAPSAGAARDRLSPSGTSDLILELETASDVAGDMLAGRRVARVIVSSPQDIMPLLEAEATFEVFVRLNRATAALVLDQLPEGHPRLALGLQHHERASDAAREDPDLRAFFAAFRGDVPVEGIPACVSGRLPRPALRVLEASMLASAPMAPSAPVPGDTGSGPSIRAARSEASVGDPARRRQLRQELAALGALRPARSGPTLDLFGFADRYIRERYLTRSHRCASCTLAATCEGIHINAVRAHGYGLLEPITGESG